MVVLSIEAPEFVPSEIPRKERDAKLSLSPLKLNASPIDQAFTDREVLQPVDEERVFAAFDQLPWTPGNGILTPSPISGRSAHNFWVENHGRPLRYGTPSMRRAGSKSPHSQRSPLSTMTHASHLSNCGSPGTPASYMYKSSNSSPVSAGTPTRAQHHMMIAGPFAVPQSHMPIPPPGWQPGCQPRSPHGHWMSPQHCENRPPSGMPPLSPQAHVSSPNGHSASQMYQWQDASGQYWCSTAPQAISPMPYYPQRGPMTLQLRSGRSLGSFASENSQNISPNLNPSTPIRTTSKPRRATPTNDSPAISDALATPSFRRPKAPLGPSGGSDASTEARQQVGSVSTDLQVAEALLQKAAEKDINSKPVQDLVSLIEPLNVSSVEMNARQRRTLRRAVERVEQELRTHDSTESADENSAEITELEDPILNTAATAAAGVQEVAA